MSKTVYGWDSNNNWTIFKTVDDDYVLQANETLLKPEASDGSGLYDPIKWNGSGWQGQPVKNGKKRTRLNQSNHHHKIN